MLWRIYNQMWSLWFWWQNVMWIICSRRWEGKSKQTFKWEKWATTEMLCSEYEIYSRWNYYYILSWNSRCSTGEWFYFYCTFHKDISQCGKFEWLLGVHYRVWQTEFETSTNTEKWYNVFRGGGGGGGGGPANLCFESHTKIIWSQSVMRWRNEFTL